MEQLIIKALKSVCGNRHFKFQVIIYHDQLHVYVNYRPNYQPNQLVLQENVAAAIASLNLTEIEDVWLYGRPRTQTEPEWQIPLELPIQNNSETEHTQGNNSNSNSEPNLVERENASPSEIDALYKDLINEIEFDESDELPDFNDFESTDSVGDTGLLQNTGLIHGDLFKEAEIDSFAVMATNNSPQPPKSIDTNSTSLIQYCFVNNKELLIDSVPDPDQKIMRMVKFVHHLSWSDRHQLLPIANSYFLGKITPELENTLPAIQNWFKQLQALDADQQHILSIWLSRYCFDPSRTLEEFQAIAARKVVEANLKSKSSTEYSLTNVEPDVIDSPNENEDFEQNQSNVKIYPAKKLLLAALWSFATIILIWLGIMNHHSNIVVGTAQAPPLCDTSIGAPEYCRLAVNLAGENAIAQAQTSLFPMTEVTEAVADYGCARYTNLKAGIEVANIAPETNPVISIKGERVFPHIYVIQTEQKVKQGGNIKVGCVYATGQGQRSPKRLAADIIPLDWPTSYYQKQLDSDNISFGIYTNPINLGLYTIFAALGIALSSWLNLGLEINRIYTIYSVALILSVIQIAIVMIPFLGLFGAITIPILTILSLSAGFWFRDFKLNWSRGYFSVAISILMIIAVQFTLYSLCLGLINNFA